MLIILVQKYEHLPNSYINSNINLNCRKKVSIQLNNLQNLLNLLIKSKLINLLNINMDFS